MDEIYLETKEKLKELYKGDELSEIFIDWWLIFADEFVNQWFRANKWDYSAEDIINNKEVLMVYIIDEFCQWAADILYGE